MAKQVKLAKGKEFTFRTAGNGQAVSKYPWDEWFNGHLMMIEESTETEKRDYDVETNFMPAKLKTAARRRYKVVQISRYDADGAKLNKALIIKARDMNADEHIAEDITRAEEKANHKARLQAVKNTSATAAPAHLAEAAA